MGAVRDVAISKRGERNRCELKTFGTLKGYVGFGVCCGKFFYLLYLYPEITLIPGLLISKNN